MAARWLLILLVLAGNGALVQVLAWGAMIATRAPDMGWSAAVASTFGGQAPCRMCVVAQALRDGPAADALPTGPATKIVPTATLALLPADPALLPVADRPIARLLMRSARCPPGRCPAPEPPPPRRV
jgi:hypothetical protein